MKHEKIYLLTDLCMWESNKKNKTFYPHAIEVVDEVTGAVHFIKSGARLSLIEGVITPRATQKAYNSGEIVPRNKQSVSKGKGSEGEGSSAK